ncbi:MAG: LysR family transcriptional regulator [Usitatibacter sp.]
MTRVLLRFDLRQVRAFLRVAEELHFGRAAEQLAMTAPAVSRTIRELEAAVGVALFERSTRRVRLTPAGAAFAAECQLAMGHLQLAANAAKSAAEGQSGRLRVGYMDFAINGRLPQILQAFRAAAPGVTVDLEYLPTAAQHRALLEGRIDIGFMIGPFQSHRMSNLLVDEDDFVAMLPEGHRLAGREALKLADLAGEPFVIGSEETFSSFRRVFFDLCHRAGFVPDVVQEASNSSGIFGLVAAGAGITAYAGCARNVRRTGVVVKSIADVRERIPIFAAWLEDHPSEALRRFRDSAMAEKDKWMMPPAGPRRQRNVKRS